MDMACQKCTPIKELAPLPHFCWRDKGTPIINHFPMSVTCVEGHLDEQWCRGWNITLVKRSGQVEFHKQPPNLPVLVGSLSTLPLLARSLSSPLLRVLAWRVTCHAWMKVMRNLKLWDGLSVRVCTHLDYLPQLNLSQTSGLQRAVSF